MPLYPFATLHPISGSSDFFVLLQKLRHVYASGEVAQYLLPE